MVVAEQSFPGGCMAVAGYRGKVVVGVNPRGEPSSVNLLQSTGNAELDRLFMRWVKENWTFYPAEKDGAPIASKVVVPVRLNID